MSKGENIEMNEKSDIDNIDIFLEKLGRYWKCNSDLKFDEVVAILDSNAKLDRFSPKIKEMIPDFDILLYFFVLNSNNLLSNRSLNVGFVGNVGTTLYILLDPLG